MSASGSDADQPTQPHANAAEATSSFQPAPTAGNEAVPVVPGFEVLGRLGAGAMGVVWKARQRSPERLVALKMIRGEALAGIDAESRRMWLERFRREADAVGRLDHAHIVPIYQAGECDGLPWYAMKHVEGPSLADFLATFDRDPSAAVALLIPLARAVHHAHQRGILHRDLKPANILLQKEQSVAGVRGGKFPNLPIGQQPEESASWETCRHEASSFLPLVTDFGLARELGENRSELTGSGAIVGTPAYMSPEQAQGQTDLTTAVDVYGLGGILYALLTGVPPFLGATRLETLNLVVHAEPERPRRFNPRVDATLEAVCLKCLHKEPGQRYASAADLADDLERWRNGEPTIARPLSAPARLMRWARRRPAVAGLLASLLVVTLVGVGLVVWKWREAVFEWQRAEAAEEEMRLARDAAEEAKEQVVRSLGEARHNLYIRSLVQASREWQDLEPGRALHLLDECPVTERAFEWYYLRRMFRGSGLTASLDQPTVDMQIVGDRALLVGLDYSFAEVNLADGKLVRSFRVPGRPVSLTLSDDGRWLVGHAGSAIEVWDTAKGECVRKIERPAAEVIRLSINRHGHVAALSPKHAITVWDENGRVRTTLAMPRPVRDLYLSPDGQRLVIVTGALLFDPGATVLDLRTRDLTELESTGGLLTSVAFSPDGKRVAGGLMTRPKAPNEPALGEVREWTLESGKQVRLYRGHTLTVNSVDYSRDGKTLIGSSDDRTIRAWSTESGAEMLVRRGHTNWVKHVRFTPTGRIVSVGLEKSLKVWDPQDNPEVEQLPGPGPGFHLAIMPDGRHVVMTTAMTAEMLPLAGGPSKPLPLDKANFSVAVSPDGRYLACNRRTPTGNTITLASTEDMRPRWSIAAPGSPSLTFSPDSTLLAAWNEKPDVRLLATDSGAVVRTIRVDMGPVNSLAFSPDGEVLALGCLRVVELRRVADGSVLRKLTGLQASVMGVAFSAAGHLAATGSGRDVRVWAPPWDGEARLLSGHGAPVYSVAFSRDGRRLASGAFEGTVKVWDTATWQELLSLKSPGRDVREMAFTADGGSLVAVGAFKGACVWRGR